MIDSRFLLSNTADRRALMLRPGAELYISGEHADAAIYNFGLIPEDFSFTRGIYLASFIFIFLCDMAEH